VAAASTAPFLDSVRLNPAFEPDWEEFPFSLPFLSRIDLRFSTVTYLVGENGSGKSTLIEALAALCRFPVAGGGREELADHQSDEKGSLLAKALRPSFVRRPRYGFFFRAELQASFASLLEQRKADPDFRGDPYARYGGRSLHTRSHGEAFLAIFEGSLSEGLYLLDEPESALSPQRQLALLVQMHRWTARGQTQFIIASHSPILMTFPNATLVNFDDPALPQVTLRDTNHYQITRGILENPAQYWKHLGKEDSA
jgi:predicted ATPase